MYKVEQHDDGLWGLYSAEGDWIDNYISKASAEKAGLTDYLHDKLIEVSEATEELLARTEGWGAREDIFRFLSRVTEMVESTEDELGADLCYTRLAEPYPLNLLLGITP